jgi:hypothetical protein
VHAAEQIVGDAWVRALIAHRDQARDALRMASECCAEARRELSAALTERSPRSIAMAHAGLEAALAAARSASSSSEQAHEVLVRELDLLAWKAIERKVSACIAGDAAAQPPAEAEPSRSSARPGSTLSRRFCRLLRWRQLAAARLTAGRCLP